MGFILGSAEGFEMTGLVFLTWLRDNGRKREFSIDTPIDRRVDKIAKFY